MYGNNVINAQLSEMFLLGVETVLRLERDAWSMVKWLWRATNQYPPPLAGDVAVASVYDGFQIAIVQAEIVSYVILFVRSGSSAS